MLNYDFYDIYAVLVAFRNSPSNSHNFDIAQRIKLLVDSPQLDNTVETNLIRRSLAQIDGLYCDEFAWIKTNNVYTYGCRLIKEEMAYHILSEAFAELLLCLDNKDYTRFRDLADALHNVPITLAEDPKTYVRRIKAEITIYRRKWNSSFLQNIIGR